MMVGVFEVEIFQLLERGIFASDSVEGFEEFFEIALGIPVAGFPLIFFGVEIFLAGELGVIVVAEGKELFEMVGSVPGFFGEAEILAEFESGIDAVDGGESGGEDGADEEGWATAELEESGEDVWGGGPEVWAIDFG